MTREEYFMCLEGYLKELTYEECKEALQYYENYFDEAGPENEQEVIEQLGSPKQLAETILHSEGIGDGANANESYEKKADANIVPYGSKVENEESSYKKTSHEDVDQTIDSNKKEQNDRTTRIIIAIVVAIVAFPTIASIFGVLIGLVCGLGFGGAGLVIGGIAGIVGGIVACVKLGFGLGLMFIGLSLIIASLGLLSIFTLYVICKYLIPICITGIKKLWNWIIGKKEVA